MWYRQQHGKGSTGRGRLRSYAFLMGLDGQCTPGWSALPSTFECELAMLFGLQLQPQQTDTSEDDCRRWQLGGRGKAPWPRSRLAWLAQRC